MWKLDGDRASGGGEELHSGHRGTIYDRGAACWHLGWTRSFSHRGCYCYPFLNRVGIPRLILKKEVEAEYRRLEQVEKKMVGGAYACALIRTHKTRVNYTQISVLQ